jgi:DNA ligase-1
VAVQAALSDSALNGLDGELIVGEPNAWDCMRQTNSGIMSYHKDIDWKFYVFDIWNRPGGKYVDALDKIKRIIHPNVEVVPQRRITNINELEQYETAMLDEGYEGLIVRRLDGAYKFGRSTHREGHLIKVKRYQQDEGKIVGFEPWYKNLNDPIVNELGYTQRAHISENKVALPMLGSFLVEGPSPYYDTKVRFSVGSGFTPAEREAFWKIRFDLLETLITYKYFPKGSKDRPRHPVFVSFCDPSNL